jgi:hypothetical protein
MQVVAHAPCPVIVVRPVSAATPSSLTANQLVVGVDGSSLSVAALEFGFREVVRLGVGVVAVHVAAPHVPGDGSIEALTEETRPSRPDCSRSPLPVGRRSTRRCPSGGSCCAGMPVEH